MLHHILGSYKSTAKLRGKMLVLSLTDAVKPVVWTLDLAEHNNGSISIEHDEERGIYSVLFTPLKKNAASIMVAEFASKSDAVYALHKATQALSQAPSYFEFEQANEGDANMQSAPRYAMPQNNFGRSTSPIRNTVLTLVGIALLAWLFIGMTHSPMQQSRFGYSSVNGEQPASTGFLSPLFARGQNTAAPAAQAETMEEEVPVDAIGVPMSAERFFSAQ